MKHPDFSFPFLGVGSVGNCQRHRMEDTITIVRKINLKLKGRIF